MEMNVFPTIVLLLIAVVICEAQTNCGKYGKYNPTTQSCSCQRGWSGEQCADMDCIHGRRALETCVCDALWEGVLCDVPVCVGNRTLNDTKTGCVCLPNYRPPNCEVCSAPYFGPGCQYSIQPSVPTKPTTTSPPPSSRKLHLPEIPHWAKVTLVSLTALATILLIILCCIWTFKLCKKPRYSKVERLFAPE